MAAAPPAPVAPLEALLKRLATTSGSTDPYFLSQADTSLLAHSLLPSSPRSSRSLAYLCLSKLCTSPTPSSDSAPSITSSFIPFLEETFGAEDGLTDPLPFTYLTASLAALSPLSAVSLLTHPLQSTIPPSDALDILLEAAELPSDLQPALAELLAQLAGSKPGRTLVSARAEAWVRGGAALDDGSEMSALCAVALSKVGREDPMPGETTEAREERQETEWAQDEALCRNLMAHVEKSTASTSTSILPTLEGLSILSTRPRCKRLLSHSSTFLSSLLSHSPVPRPLGGSLPITPRASMSEFDESTLFEPVETGLCYGLATILSNLSARRGALSEEDEQVARIRRMAISGKGAVDSSEPDEDDEAVIDRVQRLYEAGVVNSLRGLARASSQLVAESVGKLCLNLVEEASDRMRFIRQGGFKSLSTVIRDLAKTKTSESPDSLAAYQALAKLTITTPPHLLFSPPYQTTALNALTPLYTLLTHPRSTSLQQFESLMALTNLASIDGTFGSRIATSSTTPPASSLFGTATTAAPEPIKVLAKIEELLLDDNTLVKRAATQLLCNLVSSDEGFAQFTGENDAAPIARVRGRLGLLLILTDVEDTPTCLAASGALAVVTDSPKACAVLLTAVGSGAESTITTTSDRTVWDRLNALFNPESEESEDTNKSTLETSDRSVKSNDDLVLRAAYIVLNLLDYVGGLAAPQKESQMVAVGTSGLRDSLMRIARDKVAERKGGESHPVLEPVLKALKLMS